MINPYEPIVSSVADSSGAGSTLTFNGVVDETDYRRLLPDTRLEWLLRIFFSLTTLIFLTILGVIGWIATYPGNVAPFPVATVVLSLPLLAACAVIPWFAISPTRRARRALRKYADLIGHFRGSLSAKGLVFIDRDGVTWITSAAVASSRINRFGMAVPIAADPYRYASLPLKIFDGATLENLKQMKHGCVQTTPELVSGKVRRLHASDAFGPADAETIYASGQLTFTTPMSWPQRLTSMAFQVIYALLIIYGSIYFWKILNIWVCVMMASLFGIASISGARQVANQWRFGIQTTIYQWFAIDSQRWIIGDEWVAQSFPHHAFTNIHWNDQWFSMTLLGVRTIFVFKSLIEGDAEWDKLRQMILETSTQQ